MKTYNQADTYDSDLSGNDYDFTPTSHRVPFFMSNGITLFAYKTDNAESKSQYKAKGSFNGEFMNLYIDINGPKTKPNVIGKDIFYFKIDNRGAVIPMGGQTSKWLLGDDFHYTSNGDYACNEHNVTIGLGCAGSIFDNNGKVIYKQKTTLGIKSNQKRE